MLSFEELRAAGAGAGCEELPWDIGSLDSDVTTARSIFGGADLASLVSWVPPLAGPGATSSSAHSPAGNQGAQVSLCGASSARDAHAGWHDAEPACTGSYEDSCRPHSLLSLSGQQQYSQVSHLAVCVC